MGALILPLIVVLLWGIEQHIGRRVADGLAAVRADLNEAQEEHIAALKEALELSERQVLLLKVKHREDLDGGS